MGRAASGVFRRTLEVGRNRPGFSRSKRAKATGGSYGQVQGQDEGGRRGIHGDKAKKAEGGPSKADAAEEAKQREKTRQAEAERAEKERDRQRRKDKGPLGGLGDALSGR